MAAKRIIGAFAVGAALSVAGAAPASAEFFGCKEPHTKVTYSSGYLPKQAASHGYTAGRARHAGYTSYSAAPRHAARRADRW